MTGQLTVEHTAGDLALARVTGTLDIASGPAVRTGAGALIDEGARHVVLDLEAVTFCDSSGLNALIGIWRRTKAADGSLTLAAVPGRLQRLLRHTGLDRLMPSYPTAADALAAQPDG